MQFANFDKQRGKGKVKGQQRTSISNKDGVTFFFDEKNTEVPLNA